ncbi:DUF3552 domain-containing protein [Patescibacteria group bacterium]|nr:DUF3552 domain-containing protein [Patescibacteria group bacterium]
MQPYITLIISTIIAASSGTIAYFFYNKDYINKSFTDNDYYKEIVDEGKEKAREVLKEAEKKVENAQKLAKQEQESNKESINNIKKSLEIKEKTLGRKQNRNDEIKHVVTYIKEEVNDLENKLKNIEVDLHNKLESITEAKTEELRDELIQTFRADIINGKESFLKKAEEDVKCDLDKTAKTIILLAIQKYANPTSVERSSTNVVIPQNIIKGRLVGRGGVNISCLEKLFPEIEFIFNHEPKTLTIGGFNLFHRNIAKLTITKLLHKREISPALIKTTYEQAKKEIDADIIKTGKKVLTTLNIKDINEKMTWLVGRLKYRTSYGQNILKHSLECSYFAMLMAGELNCNVQEAKISAFFHDIGKAIDHDQETEEGHDVLSKEVLEEHGFSENIVHAAYAHHEAVPCKTPEAMLVKAADALSAGRPGARQESIETYLKRIVELERMASGVQGVKKVYSVSAGREVRLFVDPEEISDDKLKNVAETAVSRIEENLNYPGKIKVTVIRNFKAVETAK